MSTSQSPTPWPGRQVDKKADEKGYITNRLAICSIAIIAPDTIIQFITFESENTSGGEWDCGQKIVWKCMSLPVLFWALLSLNLRLFRM